jgi:hypothetical protein
LLGEGRSGERVRGGQRAGGDHDSKGLQDFLPRFVFAAAMTRGEHGSLIEAAVHDIHHVI